jgi:flavorubredoxin
MTMTDVEERPAAAYQVADETFVIPWYLQAPPVGYFCMNSLVIRGSEPVIVDTGPPANRDAWLAAVFGLVEPHDVRWIFLSHDDRDHSGNLLQVLDACPNATLLTNWFSIGRMAEEWMTPLPRCRFVNEGDRIDIGDRSLTAVLPPLFDNPTTRGLFDDRTGVFWAVDTFASPVPAPLERIDDLADADFVDGQQLGARLIAPWHVWLDERRFHAHVDSIQSMPITVVASCHAPTITGERIERGFNLLRGLPTAQPWEPFTQADLEQWLAAMAVATDSASQEELS